ncbi:hypothetical protein [Candidatus Macondimonas diazotrophica]|uniref:Phage tail protein n=1 Tax=Candidatus Macondimonas diazotrophica TaxID=2305248 RepID=A0A4Z0F6X0_9GAMM|nr:hypothetical protein [Candidatus Macondimonas diazotrophica]TFZ81386.1 hypothetical protein E4680_12675 [Candidatus Macondimonas diazotrophica]
MIELFDPHFVYTFRCFDRHGRLKWEWTEKNLIPNAGRDYIIAAAFSAGSQFGTWYISLYSGAYTPQLTDTAANYPANATEITTAYSEANRPTLVPDAPGSGLYTNAASPAVFTFTATTTVQGGGLHSNSVKGGTTGILASVVAAPSPKTVNAGDVLNVIAGVALTSS